MKSLVAHAGDMTRPAKLPVPDVDIDCLKSQPASKLRVRDVVSPHVPSRDAASGSVSVAEFDIAKKREFGPGL